MERVLIIGCSGVGKSTLAARVSAQTGSPYIPTDPFYWQANWQPASTERVVERVNVVTKQDLWILDGNFDDQCDLVWQRADTLIWLDYPLWRILFQVTRRNVTLWLTQKPTWSGNRMTLKIARSGVGNVFRSHSLKRARYPGYMAEFPHLKVCHFQQPSKVDKWVASLTQN